MAGPPENRVPIDYSCPRVERTRPDGWTQDLAEAAWGCFKLLVGVAAFVAFFTIVWLIRYAIWGS